MTPLISALVSNRPGERVECLTSCSSGTFMIPLSSLLRVVLLVQRCLHEVGDDSFRKRPIALVLAVSVKQWEEISLMGRVESLMLRRWRRECIRPPSGSLGITTSLDSSRVLIAFLKWLLEFRLRLPHQTGRAVLP